MGLYKYFPKVSCHLINVTPFVLFSYIPQVMYIRDCLSNIYLQESWYFRTTKIHSAARNPFEEHLTIGLTKLYVIESDLPDL